MSHRDHHTTHEGGHRRHRPGGRRFFRSGELHLVLLALLAQRPQHGYDLMAELEALFGPEYRPSPGSIYPALNALETEGLIASRSEGDRNVFSLTPTGEAALEERAGMLAAVSARTGTRLGSRSVEGALARLVARVRAVAAALDAEAAGRILEETGDRFEALAAAGPPRGAGDAGGAASPDAPEQQEYRDQREDGP